MEIPRSVRHPIETFRTAPLGIGTMACFNAAAVAAIEFYPALTEPEPDHVTGYIIGAIISVAGTFSGGMLASNQLRLRDRVEFRMRVGDLSNWYLERSAETWCGRQTVRTVVRGTEHELAFQDICAATKPSNKLTWLPNF